MRDLLARLALLAPCLICATLLSAQEAERVVEQTSGVIDIDYHNAVEFRGVQGTVNVRAGREGEMRFMCRALDNKRTERPIGLWTRGKTLIYQPASGDSGQQLILEVTVPPGMLVDVEIDNSILMSTGLVGRLKARGSEVRFQGRGMKGEVDLAIKGGSVNVSGAEEGLSLEAQNLDVKIDRVKGSLNLELEGGKAHLAEIDADASIDLEEVEFVLQRIGGELELTANESQLQVLQLSSGGVLNLSGSPAVVQTTRSMTEIETDRDLEFGDIQGGLRIESYGGTIVGSTVSGGIEVNARETAVHLEKVDGPTLIRGDTLQLRLVEIKGELTVQTSGSSVFIDQAGGQVNVLNDFGDIELHKAEKPVRIQSTEGNVQVTELSGPVEVKAEGGEVVVHWIANPPDQNSLVENSAGDVRLMFSDRGGGRIEASARYGRIESELQGLVVADDGTTASGIVNRVNRPTIQVVSGGNVYVSGAEPSKKP